MNIPKNLPYNENFMFFGVKAKDMTRTELLQVIHHLSQSMLEYKKCAEDTSKQLEESYKKR